MVLQVAYDSNLNQIDSLEYVWALPVGLFLTSFGWWESFVDENSFSPGSNLTNILWAAFSYKHHFWQLFLITFCLWQKIHTKKGARKTLMKLKAGSNFKQHFTSSFFIPKCCAKLLCAFSFGLYFFVLWYWQQVAILTTFYEQLFSVCLCNFLAIENWHKSCWLNVGEINNL